MKTSPRKQKQPGRTNPHELRKENPMYQLIALRKKKKLSQQELANKLGITRARLSQWEINEHL